MSHVSELDAFHADFCRAIAGDDSLSSAVVTHMAQQPGFAIYRNTVMHACIDALQANFPTIVRLVGEQFFRAAAGQYVAVHKPRTPCMLGYGASFPGFLRSFSPAAELPYLADVATLDWHWLEVHGAADCSPLPAAALAGLSPARLADIVLRPVAAARWNWFDAQPACRIWEANRLALPFDADLPWCGDGMLLVRRDANVTWHELDRPSCLFLDHCAAGMSLDAAIGALMSTHPDTAVDAVIAPLIHVGAFSLDSLSVSKP